MSVSGERRKEEPGDAGRAEGAGRLFVLQEPGLPGGTLLALSWVPPRGWEALSPRGQGQLLKGPVLGPAATARKPGAPGGGQGPCKCPFSRHQSTTPLVLFNAHQPPNGVGAFLILTLQVRTLSFREVKSPVEGHPALK